jgi:hypothetical protein
VKIIFLDFDGVLNSFAFLDAHVSLRDRLDPAAVARLNVLVERSRAKVVVSSTWRLKRSLEELRARLAEVGFVGEVIGCTPVLPAAVAFAHGSFPARCQEIQAWIDAQPEPPESFVILDDAEFDYGSIGAIESRIIRTEFASGLQDEHVELAVEALAEPH